VTDNDAARSASSASEWNPVALLTPPFGAGDASTLGRPADTPSRPARDRRTTTLCQRRFNNAA
jgi:hypothetical protein